MPLETEPILAVLGGQTTEIRGISQLLSEFNAGEDVFWPPKSGFLPRLLCTSEEFFVPWVEESDL